MALHPPDRRNGQSAPTRPARKHATVRERPIVNSNDPVVSVIIPVMNEVGKIGAVIREARRVHPSTEVIVVANGSRDGSEETAERLGARVIHYPDPLGHDVGRSVGAREAKGKILLFTDGDIVLSGSSLRHLVHAVENGVDVALNSYAGPIDKMTVHDVVLSKHALNAFLSYPQLKGTSMTTIPHAISRKALREIGAENLAVPPKAQAIAALAGLRIRAVHYYEVGKSNPLKKRAHKTPLSDLILGDHLEAINYLLKKKDFRGHFPDADRNREKVR